MAARPAPLVKVCCIASVDEARLAVQGGAAALGFVSQMPSGPGVIDDARIAEIVATVPPAVATFLLTARVTADAIAAQHEGCGTTTIQLVDAVAPDELIRLRRLRPGVTLVQVIHVTGAASLDAACAVAPHVDALLLDSGNPMLAVKELGGTGRVHDWAVSRRIRNAVAIPVFLAGGLSAANVVRAMAVVEPYGLDLCSGVRRDGRLDAAALDAFMQKVRGATPG
jgi:phosphoribosylanthranilate isomerase